VIRGVLGTVEVKKIYVEEEKVEPMLRELGEGALFVGRGSGDENGCASGVSRQGGRGRPRHR